MLYDFQDSPVPQTELTYLTSEDAAFVVCLDSSSGQQQPEEEEDGSSGELGHQGE